MNKVLRILILQITMLLPAALSACSAGSQPEKYEVRRAGDYHVSVYSDGKEVKDFNSALVERLIISRQAIDILNSKQTQIPVSGKPERDNRGQSAGVRISTGVNPKGLSMFGFREKDLLTAVGNRRAESIDDLRYISPTLEKGKVATVTLERNGKPHKILYYLSDPGKRS